MYPARATCIRIHIDGHVVHVAGYKLLVRDTCRLYLGDIITIHLCHGRLVSLCIHAATDGRQTGNNFVADTRNMLTATSGYKWIQFVSDNMCPGVNAALVRPIHAVTSATRSYLQCTLCITMYGFMHCQHILFHMLAYSFFRFSDWGSYATLLIGVGQLMSVAPVKF